MWSCCCDCFGVVDSCKACTLRCATSCTASPPTGTLPSWPCTSPKPPTWRTASSKVIWFPASRVSTNVISFWCESHHKVSGRWGWWSEVLVRGSLRVVGPKIPAEFEQPVVVNLCSGLVSSLPRPKLTSAFGTSPAKYRKLPHWDSHPRLWRMCPQLYH